MDKTVFITQLATTYNLTLLDAAQIYEVYRRNKKLDKLKKLIENKQK